MCSPKFVYLTNSTEPRPSWEATSYSATQEILWISGNPMFHFHVHNSQPLVPILNQTNQIHIFKYPFFESCLNIILPSMSRSSYCSVSSGSFTKVLCARLFSSLLCMPRGKLWKASTRISEIRTEQLPNAILKRCRYTNQQGPDQLILFRRINAQDSDNHRIPIAADPGSIQGQAVWDFWWAKWHWGGIFSSTSVSPVNCHSTTCSTFFSQRCYAGCILRASLNNQLKKEQTHKYTVWTRCRLLEC
jgi:hypothetical protein